MVQMISSIFKTLDCRICKGLFGIMSKAKLEVDNICITKVPLGKIKFTNYTQWFPNDLIFLLQWVNILNKHKT